jgi:hypothetical protein
MNRLINGFLCIICLTLAACANQINLGEEFQKNVKDYNRMIRWHEIENAGMTYIAPEQREEHLKRAEILKKRGLSITDYRLLSARYIPEKKTGDAIAEFDYYILPSNRIKTVSYRQAWVYHELDKSWFLKSVLPDFE